MNAAEWTWWKCRRKISFDSRHKAVVAGRRHGRHMNVYRCDLCHGWRLATKKPKERDTVSCVPTPQGEGDG